jgi:biopolymer transport protein ExbD
MQSGGSDFFSSLNVTPFIDVMLVLLVIFMITSSVMIAELQVNLPTSTTAQEKVISDVEILRVSILKTGAIIVQDKPVTDLKEALASAQKHQVVIDADAGVEYGALVAVMDALKHNGVHRVSLSTKVK